METRQAEATELGARLDAAVNDLVYAYLEAREEQENLIAAGLSQKQIEAVGVIRPPSFNPLAIVARARAVGE